MARLSNYSLTLAQTVIAAEFVSLFVFTEQFHIFVGDLSAEIETQQLKDAFTPFGEIS